MVKIKIRYWVLIASILFLIGLGQSLDLSVEIAESAEYSIDGLEVQNSTTQIDSVSFTVENTGSLGCEYQASILYGEDEVAWTNAEALWPGDSIEMTSKKVFSNTTEKYDRKIRIEFCEQTETLEIEDLEVEADLTPENNVESQVFETSEEGGEVYIPEVNKGYLVPISSPTLWKTSSSKVDSSTAKLEYNPPIFRERTLNYYVVENGDVIGKTEVDLHERPSLLDRIRNIGYYFS